MLVPALALSALVILTAVTGIVLVRRKIAIVAVTGPSMEPTLTAGDRVVVRRTGLRAVRTGQIVVVEAPSTWTRMPSGRDLHREWMIKRVAAIPGDPLPAGLPAMLAGDARVPAGKLVVLGDNSKSSMDSRSLGYVPGDRLLGVVSRPLPRRSA